MPSGPVRAVSGDTEPPPPTTVNFTSALGTGASAGFFTTTRTLSRRLVPGDRDCSGDHPDVSIFAGPSHTTCTAIGFDATPRAIATTRALPVSTPTTTPPRSK